MASITPTWSAAVQIEGTGDGYTTLAGTTEEFSDNVDMSAHDAAHVIVEIDFDATPTDNVDVSIYGSIDGVNFDDVALTSIRIDNATDPAQITIPVEGITHFRVGFVQTGSTDSHNVRAYVRKRSWTSA